MLLPFQFSVVKLCHLHKLCETKATEASAESHGLPKLEEKALSRYHAASNEHHASVISWEYGQGKFSHKPPNRQSLVKG